MFWQTRIPIVSRRLSIISGSSMYIHTTTGYFLQWIIDTYRHACINTLGQADIDAATKSIWVQKVRERASGSIQGHGDRHSRQHQDPLHAGILAHPAPTGPTQQGTGIVLLAWPYNHLAFYYYCVINSINLCFAFPFRLAPGRLFIRYY